MSSIESVDACQTASSGMAPPAVFTQTATLELELRLEHIELEPGLCAFRLTTGAIEGAEVPAAFALRAGRTVQEGLARTKAVREFLAGRAKHVETLRELTLVVPEYRELARTLGFMRALEALETSKTRCEVDTPFQAFVQGAAQLDDIVRMDHGSHMLFDRKGEVLPVGVFFNYMHGNVSEAVYDLPRALEVLSANPQVTLLPAEGRSRSAAAPGIQPIPYYNAEAGRASTITFRFAPTVEQARAMWVEQQRLHSKYPSTRVHQAIFNLDLLGLRAGGAARFDDYFGHIEVACSAERGDD